MRKILFLMVFPGACFLIFSFVSGRDRMNSQFLEISKDNSLQIIKILGEVKEMEPSTESLISRQFFVGEDDDDTNKDIHVHVLIQAGKQDEKMTLQVSYFERSGSDSRVSVNKGIRNIICRIKSDRVNLIHNDYDSVDLEEILTGILKAVRDKKNLLSLLKKKYPS
jgi:hypothetical protein